MTTKSNETKSSRSSDRVVTSGTRSGDSKDKYLGNVVKVLRKGDYPYVVTRSGVVRLSDWEASNVSLREIERKIRLYCIRRGGYDVSRYFGVLLRLMERGFVRLDREMMGTKWYNRFGVMLNDIRLNLKKFFGS